MPARARRRAIQPGRRMAIAVDELGEALDMAAYISPPTMNTATLATGTPCHSTENNRQRTLTRSGMRFLPTLHCENEAGHDRALERAAGVPGASACDQPELEAFPKRSRSVRGAVAGITIRRETHLRTHLRTLPMRVPGRRSARRRSPPWYARTKPTHRPTC